MSAHAVWGSVPPRRSSRFDAGGVRQVVRSVGGSGYPGAMPSSLPLSELADRWFDERRTLGRTIGDATEEAYRRDLTRWAWHLGVLGEVPYVDGREPGTRPAGFVAELSRLTCADLGRERVLRAAAQLTRDGYAASSRARMLSAMRGFCRWLVIQGHLEVDPTADLGDPAQPDRLPAAFTSGQLEKLVATVAVKDEEARFPWVSRDLAILALLAGAGVRASELCALDVGDLLDMEDPPLLKVTGKGGHVRHVPVAGEVVETVQAFLADRQVRFEGAVGAEDPLVVRYNGRRFTRGALGYHVSRWVERAGVAKPEGECAHAFRHTYAKGLLANGVPLPSIQKLLGHRSLATTEVYLRMTGLELADAAQSVEVRAMLRDVAVDAAEAPHVGV